MFAKLNGKVKVKFLLLISLKLLFVLVSTMAEGQTKKAATKPIAAKEIGPLNVDDYGFYILVQRNGQDNIPADFYSLKPNVKEKFDYRTNIIMDIRTGKEISWWPFVSQNYHSKEMNMLYSYNSETIFGFSTTGKPVFKNLLRMTEEPYRNKRISLSSNWEKGVFTYNQDLWIVDFNKNLGTVGKPKQITFNGVMAGEVTYLKDDFALTTQDYMGGKLSNGKLINYKTGDFIEIPERWELSNTYITDLFSIQGYEPGLGLLAKFKFIPDSQGISFISWLNPEQTKYIMAQLYSEKSNPRKRRTRYYLVESGKSQVEMKTPILSNSDYSMAPDNGATVSQKIIDKHRISPNSKNIFWIYSMDEKNRGMLIFDLETGIESYHPIYTQEPLSYLENDRAIWTDDEHILLTLKPGDLFNNLIITTSTQGTYIYNVLTKSSKKTTAYLTDQDIRSKTLHAITSRNLTFTIFTANNLLFRCKPDGSELMQLSTIPNLYTLNKPFLDINPGLK